MWYTAVIQILEKARSPVTFSSDPPVHLLMAFQQTHPDTAPDWLVQAPGREMWAAAVALPNAVVTLVLADSELKTTFSLRSARQKSTVMQRPLPGWSRYAAGVLVALQDAGLDTGGLLVVLGGSEPAGPRYDHALGMVMAALAYELCAQPYTSDSLLELLEQVRRDYLAAGS